MTRGRRSDLGELVNRLTGSLRAKARLTLILEALSGRRTVAVASAALGLAERRFHTLRALALQAALESLEPRPAGRRSLPAPEKTAQVMALESTIRELRIELHAAQVREEIALTMPHLFRKGHRQKGRRQRTRTRTLAGRNVGHGGCDSSGRKPAGHDVADQQGNEEPASRSAASVVASLPFAGGQPALG
jgi:hypothetical protein